MIAAPGVNRQNRRGITDVPPAADVGVRGYLREISSAVMDRAGNV